MNIYYNGTDITSSVHPIVVQFTDNTGGKPDSLSLVFADPSGLWSQWKPMKNDTLQVKEKSFDTGVMYIDQISQQAGSFGMQALSIPLVSKTARSQGWENVRFLELVTQIAARYNLKVQTYNVSNYLYTRVDQQDEADFAFLAYRCMLEGYVLKITNQMLVVQNEADEGNRTKVTMIRASDIIRDFDFIDKSTDIYGACQVISQSDVQIKGIFKAPDIDGAAMREFLYVSNQAEADRWARGLLRNANKYRIMGRLTITLNTGLAAGSVLQLYGIGYFDGLYVIDCILHDLASNRSKLTIRRVLEGYV
ncbi:phage late control D family protein [Gorillibacterium massiliense]|uniref:phage late control D family protein n=1 Tax=Gorillibacterium massiliense TaxID=1280390 RepID=UPI0004BBCC4F|nr:phage late control D family protein [Gorillibacterium massiliense]